MFIFAVVFIRVGTKPVKGFVKEDVIIADSASSQENAWKKDDMTQASSSRGIFQAPENPSNAYNNGFGGGQAGEHIAVENGEVTHKLKLSIKKFLDPTTTTASSSGDSASSSPEMVGFASHRPTASPTRSPSEVPYHSSAFTSSSIGSGGSSDIDDDYTFSSSEWAGMKSYRPSIAPSVRPIDFLLHTSVEPTKSPSSSPTRSLSPTIAPTRSATSVPTRSLPLTLRPTAEPYDVLSLTPTLITTSSKGLLTINPTVFSKKSSSVSPSLAPSVSPSLAPSVSPSLAPSVSPSLAPS
ncbi:hypothetical protein EON65_41120, partial [archaeon]